MDTIEVEGLRIAYTRAGTGPAVVFLHGYVGDGATTWRRQIEELSGEFTTVAGHVCNVEAPDKFNTVVRDFLRAHRS